MIHYGESVANSPLAVKHFARTLPLVAKSGEVVNHFAANFFFAATLQYGYGSFTAENPFHKGSITQKPLEIFQ